MKWGFPARHGGIPKVDGLEGKIILLRWMMTGGTPILGNLHIGGDLMGLNGGIWCKNYGVPQQE